MGYKNNFLKRIRVTNYFSIIFSIMKVNQNNITSANLVPSVMFVDMNSFFPSCEQQVNYWLRHRPIGVCVYTGRQGAVIALSKEAKKMGIKPARIDQIMQQCPEFVPLETNPARYREFHIKIMKVLKQFSEDVIPKSIDEAVINFSSYHLVYSDLKQVALDIKKKIRDEVGDWFTCSIGIAPNAFLAKFASGLQKPDGLQIITPENIDSVLERTKLTDLPGISKGMALRLIAGNIYSPLQLRHTPPEVLHRVCKSIVGEYWHYRLNFKEVDMSADEYKGMQAMRQISKEQRSSIETLHDILRALCLQLEKRMVRHDIVASYIGFSCSYEEGYSWSDHVHTAAIQDGVEIMNIILGRMRLFELEHSCEPIINHQTTRMCVFTTELNNSGPVQYSMFGSNLRKDNLRKTVYELKNKFGFEKIFRAAEMTDTPVLKDVIGFGSIKDLM